MDIVMLREKSHCFVKCSNTSSAIAIYNAVHGISRLGQNGGIVYLSYCTEGNWIHENYVELKDIQLNHIAVTSSSE